MAQLGYEDSEELGSNTFLNSGDQPEAPEATLTRVLRISDEMPQKPQLLNAIGDTFFTVFGGTRNVDDIDNCILAYEMAIQLLPANDSRLAGFLHDYGISVLMRHKLTGTGEDIDQAVTSLRKSVQLTPDSEGPDSEGHDVLSVRLNNLGILLQRRFKHSTGDFADIFEAISYQQKAIQLTPESHSSMPGFLTNIGVSLLRRFEHTGDVADISEGISYQQRAVQLTPEDHVDLPAVLDNIGVLFLRRFERTGDLADISEAISYQQKAVQLSPEDHADLSSRLNNLGISLHARFEHTGEFTDISEAISYQQKAVQLTPESRADLPAFLSNVGISLQTHFEHTRDISDISEAITYHQMAVQLSPEDHPGLFVWLNNLGNSFRIRFEHTGDLSDIAEAISYQQKAAQLTPENHADLPAVLSNVGTSLLRHFERTGDLVNISEAISYQQKAVHRTPEGHAHLPGHLNNLGMSLQARFERAGDLIDISEAVSYHQKAAQLTPDGHADLPSRLNNLGNSLQRRFRHTGDLPDISEAISYQQKAVELTSEGHEHLPGSLNNLGMSLQLRFNHTRNLSDISEAISYQQKAVQLTSEGLADLPAWLNNLGILLQARFEHTNNFADISKAISSYQRAVQLTPEKHASLSGRLNNLGNTLEIRLERTKDEADVTSIISHYRLSATSASGPPLTRLTGAEAWAQWAHRTDPLQLLEAYSTAIQLISQVAGLDQTIHSRHINLIKVSEISAAAAAAAIQFEQYSLALEWLEQGRCLVWSQLNDLRSPIDDLRAHSPALAIEIMRVSRAFENAGSRAEPAAFTDETSMTTKMSIQDEAHTHIKLAQEWAQLLAKVRAIPQFEDFLQPASCSTILKNIPDYGHVIVVNIHQHRSDALVLTSGAKEPLHIALPEFPYEKADSLRYQLKALLHDSRIRMRSSELGDTRGSRRSMPGIADILRQLWTFVVKPILDGIGYSVPASKIPRIWWCVSGPLAFLPIHAAGIYSSAERIPGIYTTLSDFAISSYTPTVKSLVEMIRKPRAITQEKMGMLMISQPDTPKMSRIPGTTVEVGAIQRLLANHKVQHLRLDRADATVNRVKKSMDTHSCIHFACHASQNTNKPLQSGFYLYDGRLELSDIIKEHLKGAELAFLSACQTSTGDEKLSEEAVHLAGGMLAAGYRGVVATMWSIKDSYGPKVAEDFYKHLLSREADDNNGSKRLNGDGAAHALHHATQQLRKTLNSSESSLLTWVPYVHFGL